MRNILLVLTLVSWSLAAQAQTATYTETPTETPVNTATRTVTQTQTVTSTVTNTSTRTGTVTQTPTRTPTQTPTDTLPPPKFEWPADCTPPCDSNQIIANQPGYKTVHMQLSGTGSYLPLCSVSGSSRETPTPLASVTTQTADKLFTFPEMCSKFWVKMITCEDCILKGFMRVP